MPPPLDTNHGAPASTPLPNPPAAAVPPAVAQTGAAPQGCLLESHARPRAGPLAATLAVAQPASSTPRSCSSDNSAMPLRTRATSTALDLDARSRTLSSDTQVPNCPRPGTCSDR